MKLTIDQMQFLLDVLLTSGKIEKTYAPQYFMTGDTHELFVNVEGGPKYTIRWEYDPVDNPMHITGWFNVGISYYMPDFSDQIRLMYLLGCAADLYGGFATMRKEYIILVARIFKTMRVCFKVA